VNAKSARLGDGYPYTSISGFHDTKIGSTERDDTGEGQASPVSERDYILSRARDLISGDRAAQYGDAWDTHARIGSLWGSLLNLDDPIPASEVAAMMICLKLIRAQRNPSYADSWIDIAGYAALGGEMAGVEL